MTNVFSQRPNENIMAWLVRLHVDPWFEDATAAELADFTGVSVKKVRRAVYSWAKSQKIKRIHSHASAIAEQIDWPGTPEGLVHLALERYAQRFTERDSTKDARDDGSGLTGP